ncbi:hypothetical protein D9757_008045 [Collybiopsis confluens]|uniref:Uncharacterized protein n=1 Tax=Collybiopsis confluens TaxID=2823264 RepID=A0A8H5M1E6_9AGAR|nr:hypothetical protein D9757_008045 [Collybiopsis confluens]
MNTQNVYDTPTGIQIGSPRMMSPRSHRTRSARTHRPRRGDFDNPTRDPPPAPSPLPVAENLLRDDSAFNIDPAAAVLGAGGESIQAAIQAEEEWNEQRRERNFVGGFMVGLKRALKPNWNNSQQRSDPEAGYAQAPYTADDTYSPRFPEEQHAHADDSYPSAPSLDSQRSPSSDTMHGTQEFPDDGTTAVDHQALPMPVPGHYVEPLEVEPSLAPDYAKMGSSSESSDAYMSRLGKFLRQINQLPWVAESRVTVDYYPGQSKRRIRPRPAHRPILSWYNRHVFLPGHTNGESLDLNAGSSPSPPPAPVIFMAETHKMSDESEPKPAFQPLILPTVPIPESQLQSGPVYFAEPINPPPRSEAQFSTYTGRSVVYSVVNPSAPSTTSSSLTSPLTHAPPPNTGIDTMTALTQSTTGYTPYQPLGSQYGRPVHEPQSQVLMSPSRAATAAHVRTGTPGQVYPYPV